VTICELIRIYGCTTRFCREGWDTQAVSIDPDGGFWYRRFPQDIGWSWRPFAVDIAADDWITVGIRNVSQARSEAVAHG
jgi:hypothetical protein